MLTHPAPLHDTVAAVRSGQLDLHTLIDQICDRVEAVDPQIEALLPEADRRQRLHAEADVLLANDREELARLQLLGALIGVKDIFHVEGLVTRAGSQVPPETIAPPADHAEALSVRRLRAAGALILGKTVTTEFAYFEPGPTRNPHNLAHTPGGSSSGSAAAVAAGLCNLALGTQTIGSVIRPAAFCGVVGFKPSFDRIDTEGIVYFSPTVDHVGLFTQDVAGMNLAASILVGDWEVGIGELPQPVLGVPDGPYLAQAEPAALAAFEEQVARLQSAGYTVKRVPLLDDVERLNRLHRRLAFAEFAQQHASIYPQYAFRYRPRTREAIEIGQGVSAEELAAGRANCLRLRNELHQRMDEAGIQLWVCPSATGPAPAGIQATGDPNMNLPWTHAGLPALTLPAGHAANGLPLGLQLVARFGGDEYLLAWAQQMEMQVRPSERLP